MAETRKPGGWDPLKGLRDLLDQGERSLNELLAERSASERQNAIRGRIGNLVLDAQKRNWELWARWFHTINLPTRTDVIRMGKVLAQLEQRLTHLETSLRNVERRLAADAPRANGRPAHPPTVVTASDRPRPARTRRPPSARLPEEKR
jgi:hypothetical protein